VYLKKKPYVSIIRLNNKDTYKHVQRGLLHPTHVKRGLQHHTHGSNVLCYISTVSNERDLPTLKGGGGGFITLNEAYYRLYAAHFRFWLRFFVQKRPTILKVTYYRLFAAPFDDGGSFAFQKRGQLTHQRDLLKLKRDLLPDKRDLMTLKEIF